MTKKLFIFIILLLVSIPVFAQVDTAWVRRYNGPGNTADGASAIAVDNSGNVYVTGESWHDYATIKYYTDGDTAWVRRYNGPVNDRDRPSALAVDGSGNVYLTGYSGGSGTYYDYATIKYYPNGDTAWVRRYNGPGSYYDLAYAIAVDNSGNVYVTGYSGGSGTYYDYATVKYYPNGDTAWVRRYNGPGDSLGNSGDVTYAIAVDNSGNVYVTGYSRGSGGNDDYATVKYYPNGDTAWVRRYNGPENSSDQAFAIAVDNSGNVYVTGSSYGSGTDFDYATIKYYPNGDTAWVRRYNGPGNDWDWAKAVLVDNSGNVYVTGVTGFSVWSGTTDDYATIKYYPNGDTAWVRRYNGPGNSADEANAIAVDNSGNVYVTGYSYGSGTERDYATIKYCPNGDIAWVIRYNGPGNYYDGAYALAVDGSGNVYVTGSSTGSGTSSDYATIKYVQRPAIDLAVDIREDLMEGNNDTTDLFVVPFYVWNNGSTIIHDIQVSVNVGGNVFSHSITSLNSGAFAFLSDTVTIPRIWENQNVVVSVTSAEGWPVNFSDSKEVSVYYCVGGEDVHPFSIWRDSYEFQNPRMNWNMWRQFFTDLSPTPGLILSLLPELVGGWRGHCFGMSASASAYFLNPLAKPIPEETHQMELWEEGVFQNIISYHLAQFVFGHFCLSFNPMEANEAEASCKSFLADNLPPLVSLRGNGSPLDAHAVSAYKLLRDHSLGKSLLYLYDNETPNSIKIAHFNLTNDSFDYPGWEKIRVFRPFIGYTDAELLDGLWNWLKCQIYNHWVDGLTRFVLGCPTKMLLTDEFGRRVGFVDGITFVNEIPEAKVTFIDGGNGDTLAFYDVPKDLNYTVKYFGCGSGQMDAEVLKPTSVQSAITLSYLGVEVNSNMVAYLLVDTTNDYTLNIDEDGNGIIDTTINPTTENLPPTSFNLLSPSNLDTVSMSPIVFSWSSSSDLNGDSVFYMVYLDSDSSFSTADSSELLTDTSWTCSISLLDSVVYFWRVKAKDNKGGITYSQETRTFFLGSTSVRGDDNSNVEFPENFSLSQNYPNPFNQGTQIKYALPRSNNVTLTIYNLLGQKVRTLIDQYQTKGQKKIDWDGKDDQGNELPSGIYFYRLQAGDYKETKRMVVLK